MMLLRRERDANFWQSHFFEWWLVCVARKLAGIFFSGFLHLLQLIFSERDHPKRCLFAEMLHLEILVLIILKIKHIFEKHICTLINIFGLYVLFWNTHPSIYLWCHSQNMLQPEPLMAVNLNTNWIWSGSTLGWNVPKMFDTQTGRNLLSSDSPHLGEEF